MPQTTAKIHTKASRVTSNVRRLEDLVEFIRLANLVPEGTWLPPDLLPNLGSSGQINVGSTWPELLERIQDLPERVRQELIERSRMEPATPEEREIVGYDYEPELFRFSEVLQHYEKIRIAYYNLRGLTRGTASLDPLENLLHALLYAKLPYLRRCGYEKCGKIFYASKFRQPGCTPEHSSNIRKANKRKRDNANRNDPKIKKKRAMAARKR